MSEFYPDVLPKVLIELREDTVVSSIVGDRVRGFEPAPDVVDEQSSAVLIEGDARGPGKYVPFIVLRQLDPARQGRVPMQWVQIVAQCYGRTHQEAARLRWAVSNAMHQRGPRIHGNRLAIYHSKEVAGGGGQETDPHTRQPLQTVTFRIPAATQAVEVAS